MSVFDKHRFEVWTTVQHPLKHTLSDFAYANDGLPGVSDVNSALNWLVAVLYPNAKPAVATVGDLPLLGNTINDYRVVLDDGDGNNAGYRWEQREGEVSASWHKIYDFDWSTDSILAAFIDITQDLYVYQKGKSDLDGSGNVITGLYAGQKVYGGNQANQNLTLAANSGDGTGPHTGYVQVDDNFRATVHNTYDFGTTAIRFKDGYLQGILTISTMALSTGLITDSTGQVSFDNENLVTTGNYTGAVGFFTSSVEVGPLAGNALILAPGSITDESGAISFGNENLSTTGTVTGAANSVFGDITLGTGSITSASAAIDFGTNNLVTTGTLGAGNATVTRLDSDNIRIDGNAVSVTNVNGSLALSANGTGVVDLQSPMTTIGQTVTGAVVITGSLDVDKISIDGSIISTTATDESLSLQPNGTGIVRVTSSILPGTTSVYDLGSASLVFEDLFMDGNISDGTTSISSATLQSLRDINVAATAGMTLFFDGTKWNPSLPDTEITHSDLSGLTTGDAGHSQFAVLAGRVGGQTLQGGTAASQNLVLESTAHATKGQIQLSDKTVPVTNASFSGSWSGTDLGDGTHYFRDIYTKGEMRGLRLENFTTGTLPSNSAQNVGRVVWATDVNKVYADNGTSWVAAGASKFTSDTVWDGVIVTLDVTVSSTITDARLALWGLHDNANDFERMYVTIKAISATQVRIQTNVPLPAGSYRLIGIE